jgi:endoglucanase
MSGIEKENTQDIGGGENVGWVDPGNWLKYQVNIPRSGDYKVSYRIASPLSGSLVLQQDNNSFPAMVIPNTNDWQNWQTVSQNVFLSAGQQTFTITTTTGDWNLNWFEFSESDRPIIDSDNDGVIDSLDDCPNTPEDSIVNSNGCVDEIGSCVGINVYPNWTTIDYDGGPKTHNEANDLMVFEGNVYSANWYTNTIPGSDETWVAINLY